MSEEDPAAIVRTARKELLKELTTIADGFCNGDIYLANTWNLNAEAYARAYLKLQPLGVVRA